VSQRRVAAAGAVSLAAYALLAVLSHSAVSWTVRMWALFAIVAITTAVPFVLMRTDRHEATTDSTDAASARLALGCAVAFGIAAAIALPIFAGDFWYYLAEGRLGAAGANVYTERLTAAALDSLPVPPNAWSITMPYGPAWVWIGTGLSRLTAPHVAWEFAAYKAVMFAAWATMLGLVYRSQRDAPASQLRSVFYLGWLPFPLVAAVAEAHNDIVMVALAVGWMIYGTAASAWPLAASLLVKYVSAPIVALAAADAVLRKSRQMLIVIGAVIVVALIIAVYWQDGALLAGLERNRAWRIYTPVALMDWLVRAKHIPPIAATIAIAVWRLLLGVLVVWYGWRYRRAPSRTSRAALSAVILMAIVLGSGYMHMHYFLWVLPGMVVASDRLLTVLAGPYVVLLPFMQILRLSEIGFSTPLRLTATLQMLVVAFWMVCAWRWWRRSPRRSPPEIRLA
jgi:hypothetical protein